MRIRVPSIEPSLELVLLVANVGLAICLAVLWLTRDAVTPVPATAVSPERPDGPPVLIVVAAGSPTDVAVGQSTAEVLGGALLEVPAGGLTVAAAAELSQSRPGRVLIVGGPAAVSAGTASDLLRYTRGSVTRLAGDNRYATAARVATSQFEAPVTQIRILSGDQIAGPPPTTGQEVADAPLLLVERDRLPAETADALRRLRPASIEVSGGSAAVSDRVLQQLRAYTDRLVGQPSLSQPVAQTG